jgi:hypothetical protein
VLSHSVVAGTAATTIVAVLQAGVQTEQLEGRSGSGTSGNATSGSSGVVAAFMPFICDSTSGDAIQVSSSQLIAQPLLATASC